MYAIYLRVSTDEQTERQTIENQREYLRQYAATHGLSIYAEYADDGVSGTIPLHRRPAGARLLADAAHYRSVLVYRLDRLGRLTRVILDAKDRLEAVNVHIASAMEPHFDGTPSGNFFFTITAGIAELERTTIADRTKRGRDRAARNGKWTNGPMPFGYTTDAAGRLTPGPDADQARTIFQNIAGGATLVAECRRLQYLGLVPQRVYAGGKSIPARSGEWRPSRLGGMIRNPVYRGLHINGGVERQVPRLISDALWYQAQDQVQRNRALPKGNQKTLYLLRGIIVCGHCGHRYAGCPIRGYKTAMMHYYRCGGQLSTQRLLSHTRCRAKLLHAGWIESSLWDDCYEFLSSPEGFLSAAREALYGQAPPSDDKDAMQKRLLQLGKERERLVTLCQRGRITLDEAEARFNKIDDERSDIERRLASFHSQETLIELFDARFQDITSWREDLDILHYGPPSTLQVTIFQRLIASAVATTTGTGHTKKVSVRVKYHWGEEKTYCR